MGMAFFVGWELWEKLVFVLACALVLTIVAGCFKLWYTHWRVRRYTALDKIADKVQVIREKSIIRSLSTKKGKRPVRSRSRRDVPAKDKGVQVPFGIRALESGTQIDEIWDSRPNSREHSRSDLYRSSKNTSSADLTSFAPRRLASKDTSDLTTASGSSMELASPVLSAHPEDDLDQVTTQAIAAGRNRYPPHSFARYEGVKSHRTINTFGPRRGDTGRRPSYGDTIQTSPSASSFVSTLTNSHSEPSSPGLEQHLHPDTRSGRSYGRSQPASIRSISADSIVAMQQRRLSQCAETGQFLPRYGSGRTDAESADGGPVTDQTHDDRLSFEADVHGEDTDSMHFSTPSIRITAGTPNLDGAPATPRPTGMHSTRRLRKRSHTRTPPSTPRSFSGPPPRGSSETLRRVNSGFAVLKPGTLDVTLATPQSAKTSRVRSSSAESGSSMEGKRGRRLQKRRSDNQASKRGSSHE